MSFSFKFRVRICFEVVTMCPILLVQQQLNSSFDEETAALLHDCYTLEEKERLKEEWRLFEEQKRNFERERNNFTEAAIRLGREVLSFLCSTKFIFDACCGCFDCSTFLWIFIMFHRKRLFRRTVLLGSRISFWTWLHLQTGDVLHLTAKVPYQ